ncbi:MAG: transporter substrate-binding domain-containing protein [Halobacteriota archaeon]
MTKYRGFTRRSYLKAVGATGVGFGVAGCLGDSETVIPGTASGFPPFEFYDGDDLVGFDIELAEAVIEEAGYEVGTWDDIEFDTLITSLQEEEIDFVAAAMSITPDREEDIDFSDPYYQADQAVLVSDDGDFEPQSLEDLEGRRVGAQSGTTGEDLVEEELIDTGLIDEDDYRGQDNYTLAVSDLENGTVDAVIVDSPVANQFADERAVHVSFVYETGEEFGFGVREGDDRLEDYNDALATLMDDGTYDDLVGEWFE